MAVQVQITMVSINTPSDCTSPIFTALSLFAAAAAHGAEPEPASLENSPRFTPFISTAPNPPGSNLSDAEGFFKNAGEYSRHLTKVCENNN